MAQAGVSDREAAAWIAEEVCRAGGTLRVAASTLLIVFAAEEFNRTSAERITAALDHEGVETYRPLTSGFLSDALIELRLARRVAPRPPREQPTRRTAQSPSPSRPLDVLAEQVTHVPEGALLAGTLGPRP